MAGVIVVRLVALRVASCLVNVPGGVGRPLLGQR